MQLNELLKRQPHPLTPPPPRQTGKTEKRGAADSLGQAGLPLVVPTEGRAVEHAQQKSTFELGRRGSERSEPARQHVGEIERGNAGLAVSAGQLVQAPWAGRPGPGRSEGKYYDASVLKVDGQKARVHYTDWGPRATLDSWVPVQDLKPRPGQGPQPQLTAPELSKPQHTTASSNVMADVALHPTAAEGDATKSATAADSPPQSTGSAAGQKLFITLKGRLANHMFQVASINGIAQAAGGIQVCILEADNERKQDQGRPISDIFDGVDLCTDEVSPDAHRIAEEGFGIYSKFLLPATSTDIMIDGYLQSYRYFPPNLQSLFTLGSNFQQSADRVLADHADAVKIGIHVRRGDLRHLPHKNLKLATAKYYENAMAHFRSKQGAGAGNLVFIVTTDNPKWAGEQECFQARDVDIVTKDCGGRACGDAEVDLAILCSCDHMVISTGTFGWWAAYLGAHSKGGEVIYWSEEFLMEHPTNKGHLVLADYYPPTWTAMAEAGEAPPPAPAVAASPAPKVGRNFSSEDRTSLHMSDVPRRAVPYTKDLLDSACFRGAVYSSDDGEVLVPQVRTYRANDTWMGSCDTEIQQDGATRWRPPYLQPHPVSDETGTVVADHCVAVVADFYRTTETVESTCNLLCGEGTSSASSNTVHGGSGTSTTKSQLQRQIWMVGDSMQLQQFASLMLLAGQQPTEPSSTEERTQPYTASVCGGRVKLGFIRNDHLTDDALGGRCDVCLSGKYMNPWYNLSNSLTSQSARP
ncbi:alpha-1,2-fucosyltransferase [bacterium]|nr:alpha-1,2-fucosyltransferase [bacterium]